MGLPKEIRPTPDHSAINLEQNLERVQTNLTGDTQFLLEHFGPVTAQAHLELHNTITRLALCYADGHQKPEFMTVLEMTLRKLEVDLKDPLKRQAFIEGKRLLTS